MRVRKRKRNRVLCGFNIVGTQIVASAAVDVFNTSGATITQFATQLSLPRGRVAGTTVWQFLLIGGGRVDNNDVSDVVGILDMVSWQWSTARLSKPRGATCATSVQQTGVAIFAGGNPDQSFNTGSNVVDIFSARTRTWATSFMSQPRINLACAATGVSAYFAGQIFFPLRAHSVLQVAHWPFTLRLLMCSTQSPIHGAQPQVWLAVVILGSPIRCRDLRRRFVCWRLAHSCVFQLLQRQSCCAAEFVLAMS